MYDYGYILSYYVEKENKRKKIISNFFSISKDGAIPYVSELLGK